MPKLRLTIKQARTSINWYLSHGFSYADTLNRLRERFGRVGSIDTEALYKYYKSTHTRAAQLANYRPSYFLEAENFPTLSKDPSRLRLTVNFYFDNPSLGRRVRRNAIVDIPSGISKKDLLATIRAKILEDLNQQYEFRKGLTEAGRRTRNLSIAQIEGI